MELEQSDPIVQAESRLESALAAEDYSEAARVRDEGLMHLVGWWSGIGDHEDCHGHLLRVFSRYGRYYGVAYSARDIADSIGWRSPVGDGPPPPSGVPVHIDSLGMPVLEIFLNPDHKGGYRKKAAYLLPLPAALDTDLDGPDSEFLTQSRVSRARSAGASGGRTRGLGEQGAGAG